MNITKFIGNYTFIKENNQSILYKIIKPTDKPISLKGNSKQTNTGICQGKKHPLHLLGVNRFVSCLLKEGNKKGDRSKNITFLRKQDD